jgi:fucose permease
VTVASAPASSLRPGVLQGIAFAGMFVFGIVMALLGAVMPVLSERLAFDLADAGMLFLVMNASMLVASLVVGPAMDRFGMKLPITAGTSLVGAGMAGMATAGSFGALLPAAMLLGFGGGALNAGANTLVADLHEDPDRKASALNLLGVFFGFGALILPFSIGALLASAGLFALLLAATALCVVTAVVGLLHRFPQGKQAHGVSLREMRRFIGTPLVMLLAFVLFFQSGNEFVLGGYFATFLTRELTLPVERASYLLAAYWAGIMLSRLVLSRLLVRVRPQRAVFGGALMSAVGAIIVAVAPSTFIAVAGVLLTAVALAGIFPTVLGIAGGAFRDHSGVVFGILFTVALTGGMTMPWLAGHLAQSSGLRPVFVLVAINFGIIALLNRVAEKRSG